MSESVIVIGAGTFGLSTGLHLLRKGAKDVTLIDPYPVPSPLSAGNDVNKILQSSANRQFYGRLVLDALKVWKTDPVFKPAFYETGIVYGTTTKFDQIKHSIDFRRENDLKVQPFEKSSDFTNLFPSPNPDQDDESERFVNWKGYYQAEKCGWTFAAKALELTFNEIIRLGGKFIEDAVEEILFNNDKSVKGVRLFSGRLIYGDKVVIAAGAQSYKFLDFQNQLLAKCWTVGHIKLTPEETAILKDIPVLISLDHGFFFEPDKNNELKFCNEFPGYINLDSNKQSIPLYKDQIPKEAEVLMRAFLKEVFPTLSKRPFELTKICWCTDTTDRHFLIGEHPDHKGLVLGTGDSGQGFKFMPIIGDFISDVVLKGDEGLDEEKRNFWKWRPEQAANRNIYDLQLRSGGDNTVKDLKDVGEWSDGRLSLENLAI